MDHPVLMHALRSFSLASCVWSLTAPHFGNEFSWELNLWHASCRACCIINQDYLPGSELRGLLHKIVRFETYLPVGMFHWEQVCFPFCETYLPPQNIPTGRYVSKRTLFCNRPQHCKIMHSTPLCINVSAALPTDNARTSYASSGCRDATREYV